MKKLRAFMARFLQKLRSIMGSSHSGLVPHKRFAGPMPWVVAIMVALTVIAAAGGLSLRGAMQSAKAGLSGGLTVQIVDAGALARERQAAAAITYLRSTKDVIAVRRVSQAEVAELIEPWLEVDITGEEAIPVPILLDVQLKSAASDVRLKQLQSALRQVAPDARVDAQSEWLRPVFNALASLQWLALVLILLLAGALIASVILAVRQSLGANRNTIEVVHLLGGTDVQITQVFQRAAGLDALGGGFLGMLGGAIVILLLGQQFASLGAGLVDGAIIGWQGWFIIVLIPVGAAALAMVTARFTVAQALRKML